MTQQAYKQALADLRRWHEGDRFMRHFDDIEAHVKAIAAPMHGVSEVKSLPPPTSILLTRNSEGRLCNPATGEPFTVVIDTIDGRKEVTHITFAGERDEPKPLPDPVLVDPEPENLAGGDTVVNVMISDMREDELRAALQRAVDDGDAAKVMKLGIYANPDTLIRILPPSMELQVAFSHGTASYLLEVVKAALASPAVGPQAVPAEPIAPEKAESVFAAVRSALDLSDVDPEPETPTTEGYGAEWNPAWVRKDDDSKSDLVFPFVSVHGVGDVPLATSLESSEIKHEGEPPTLNIAPRSEQDYEALTNVEIRQALYDAVASKSMDTAWAILFGVDPERLKLSEIGISRGEFQHIVHQTKEEDFFAALKEALDTPYVFGDTSDKAEDDAYSSSDIANTADGGVPTDGEVPAKASRKSKARKKAGS